MVYQPNLRKRKEKAGGYVRHALMKTSCNPMTPSIHLSNEAPPSHEHVQCKDPKDYCSVQKMERKWIS